MYLSIYVLCCFIHGLVAAHTNTSCMYVCFGLCVRACMIVRMYVYVHVRLYVCMHVRMYVCMCVCMYVCTYVCIFYVCMYAYMHSSTSIAILIHSWDDADNVAAVCCSVLQCIAVCCSEPHSYVG